MILAAASDKIFHKSFLAHLEILLYQLLPANINEPAANLKLLSHLFILNVNFSAEK